jgi:hypothetical protein
MPQRHSLIDSFLSTKSTTDNNKLSFFYRISDRSYGLPKHCTSYSSSQLDGVDRHDDTTLSMKHSERSIIMLSMAFFIIMLLSVVNDADSLCA